MVHDLLCLHTCIQPMSTLRASSLLQSAVTRVVPDCRQWCMERYEILRDSLEWEDGASALLAPSRAGK